MIREKFGISEVFIVSIHFDLGNSSKGGEYINKKKKMNNMNMFHYL